MEQFDFDIDHRFRVLLRLWGVHADNCYVRLTDDDRLLVRFGRLGLKTPLSNVASTKITEDYRWFKAIGPRASLADWGATFGTNARRGLCICFRQPVKALLWDFRRHPAVTVTVADPEGLAAAIAAGSS